MQIVPRHDLSRRLRQAGLEPDTRDFAENEFSHRLTLRECAPLPFVAGPHRKVVYADGRVEGPFPLGDRPALSGFVATLFAHLNVPAVLATVADGTFWLNNKAQAEYLRRVPDAERVTRFLRRRGLTNRFRGGFAVRADAYRTVLPVLAANTFAGGGDVLFASLAPDVPLTVLACHHFDLHVSTPNAALLSAVSTLACRHDLALDSFALPDALDLPAGIGFWPEDDAEPESLPVLPTFRDFAARLAA